MFKFTTNTIINSLNDPTFGNVPTTADGGETIKDHLRFWVENAKDEAGAADPIVRIAKHFKFNKSNVVSIYERKHSDPVLFSATFDMSKVLAAFTASGDTKGVGRIVIYVRLSGSQNSFYSNDFVFKGKPFFIEFPITKTDTATTLATKVVSLAKKYQNFTCDFPLINISSTDGTVTISGIDEYQVLKIAELQYYDPDMDSYDCCAKFGDFDSVAEGVIVTQGKEGFGTFRQLMKDFRLPTAANTRWIAIAQDDKPIPGASYNEYIINMCVDRGIMGGDAVGEVTKSYTTHVFYVNNNTDLITAWEAAIGKLVDKITVIDKDLNDVLQTQETLDDADSDPKKVVAAEKAAHAEA